MTEESCGGVEEEEEEIEPWDSESTKVCAGGVGVPQGSCRPGTHELGKPVAKCGVGTCCCVHVGLLVTGLLQADQGSLF